MFANESERDEAIRRYAAGELPLTVLQQNGLDNFLDVLRLLGKLGLRQPVAPLDGPHAELRARARALIAERLRRT